MRTVVRPRSAGEPAGVRIGGLLPMRFRQKTEDEVIADAIKMAERKEAEGCSPCAEQYRLLARRSLLRAGGFAVGALAVSMTDVSAIAAPGRAKADAVATDAQPRFAARQLSGPR